MSKKRRNTKKKHKLPPGFRLYSVGVSVAFPTISTEVKIYPFTMLAQSEYEAVARIFSLLLESGYDPLNHLWGSNNPVPTEIFHIDATLYPDSLLESALAEIDRMPDPKEETASIIQLFLESPSKSEDTPPDDKPPKE